MKDKDRLVESIAKVVVLLAMAQTWCKSDATMRPGLLRAEWISRLCLASRTRLAEGGRFANRPCD